MMHSLDLTITGVERIKFDLFLLFFFVCFFWEFSFSIFVRLLVYLLFLHENLQFTRLKFWSFDFALLRHGLLFSICFVTFSLEVRMEYFQLWKNWFFLDFFFSYPFEKLLKKWLFLLFFYSLVWIILGQPTKHFFFRISN